MGLMMDKPAKTLIERFPKSSRKALRRIPLREDDDGRRERRAQRPQPPHWLLHLRHLRNG
ncbi:MAG: hypothetical protein V8T01_11495 [Oscillospiraceae bacterium]